MTHSGDERMNMEQMKKENEWLKKQLKCWGKMLDLYGINDERMSAALTFAFGDGDSSLEYLANMLNLSEEDFDWFREMHGMDESELEWYRENYGDEEE